MIKIDWLESFLIFSESLNFTKAAALLRISQPALFKKIQMLSQQTGLPLYSKTGRNLVLTDAGHKVAVFGRDIVERVQYFEQSLKNPPLESKITLAAGQGSYLYLLGPAIKKFCRQHRSKPVLLTADHDQTIEWVRTGRAQLGFTVLTQIPSDLEVCLVYEQVPQLVLPRDHPLCGRKQIRIQELDSLSLIVPPKPSVLRDLLDSVFSTHKIRMEVAVEAGGWELMLQFVSLGFGVTIVNGCCKISPDLVSIPIRDLPSTKYYLLNRREQFEFRELKALKVEIVKLKENTGKPLK